MGKDTGNGSFKDVTVKIRRDTAAGWTFKNPVLASGEPGYETDTRKLKFGNGSQDWVNLPYFISSSTSTFAGANNGLIVNNGIVQLGGPLIQNVQITGAFSTSFTGGTNFQVDCNNIVLQDIANNNTVFVSNIDVHMRCAGFFEFTLDSSIPKAVFIDSRGAGAAGIEYNADYSATYSNRSLIDKGYINGRFVPYTGAVSSVDLGANDLTANFLFSSAGGVTGGVFAGVNSSLYLGTTSNHDVNLFANNGSAAINLSKTNSIITLNSIAIPAMTAQVNILSGSPVNTLAIRNNTDTTDIFTFSKTGLFTIFGNVVTDTVVGMKLWTATNQKGSFWGATPIIQPTQAGTTAVATYNFNGGTGLSDTDTFGPSLWTWRKFIQAIFNTGLLNP